MSSPITTRYPQLVEAFEFIKGEYTYAKLSWCSSAAYEQCASDSKSLGTTTATAAKTQTNTLTRASNPFGTTGTKPNIFDNPATYTAEQLAAAFDELYAAMFPEEMIF